MMENIIQNPGLQHIIEKSLTFLDQKSIAAFRSVNRDCRRITDCPTFYLKKFATKNPLETMREIVHMQAGQCGNQIGAKVKIQPLLHISAKLLFLSLKKVGNFWRENCYKV